MKPIASAAIIAVGSELLTPSKIDTNSLFITEQLNLLGIDVKAKAVVGDDSAELEHVLRSWLARADLVIMCGGLGPTDDDLTREVVAAVLDRPLAEDEAITAQLRARFASRNLPMPMPESNRRQAMVPRGAQVLANARGSAPGLWIDHGDRLVLLLPGPPRELRPMLTELVEGPLKERSGGSVLVRRIVRVAGRIESHVDEKLHPLYGVWEKATPPIAATILAALGSIELHVSTRAATREAAGRGVGTCGCRGCRCSRSRRVQHRRPTARSRRRRSPRRAGTADRRRRVVHGRSALVATDRRARQLAVCGPGRDRVLERSEDAAARTCRPI